MRYAIYFSPSADHPLTKAAARWLGRDAFTGETFAPTRFPRLSPQQLDAITSIPRRYGFHATLKAPFEPGYCYGESDLQIAAERFAAVTPALEISEIALHQIGNFFALVPNPQSAELQSFAAQVVEYFDPLRAPLSKTDLERREPEKLSPGQRANLERWGYPYVMDEFKFHMTLTGSVPQTCSNEVMHALEEQFSQFLGKQLTIDALSLFLEPERGAPFQVHSRYALKTALTTESRMHDRRNCLYQCPDRSGE